MSATLSPALTSVLDLEGIDAVAVDQTEARDRIASRCGETQALGRWHRAVGAAVSKTGESGGILGKSSGPS